MKRYLKVKTTPDSKVSATHLRVETIYNKGGMNVFTYNTERRGYYLHVTPVKRERNMESFVAFTGTKMLLKEVTRKGAKAEQEADSIVDQRLPELVKYVCQKNGLTLEEGETE